MRQRQEQLEESEKRLRQANEAKLGRQRRRKAREVRSHPLCSPRARQHASRIPDGAPPGVWVRIDRKGPIARTLPILDRNHGRETFRCSQRHARVLRSPMTVHS